MLSFCLCVMQEEKCFANVVDSYGHKWQVGDVVGVCLDLVDRTISECLGLGLRCLPDLGSIVTSVRP